MLLLTTTSDVIRILADTAATIDVHASWVDRSGSTDTPGSTNTAIASAGSTTTVIAAPASSTTRNVRRLNIRNKSASTSCTVTVQLYNGTAYELEKRALGPGQSIVFDDGLGWTPRPTGGPQTRPWYGQLAGCFADGDPGHLLYEVQRGVAVSPTGANITVTVARCSAFVLPFDMTVNTIRYYGIGTGGGANVFRVALYRMSDLAQLTADLGMTCAAGTWGSVGGGALGVSLLKDTCYFVATTVTTVASPVVGPVAIGTTIAAGTGMIGTAPGSLPGSMAIGASAYMGGYQFQFTVAAGVLPNPANTLAAQAAWTGGMPAFWLDAT